MPNDDMTQANKETAEDIFHQLSNLIARRLHDGQEETSQESPSEVGLDREITEELRRLREVIRQDEEAHAAALAAELGPPEAPSLLPDDQPQGEAPRPHPEMSEGLRLLFRGAQPETAPVESEVPAQPAVAAAAAPVSTEALETQPAFAPRPAAKTETPASLYFAAFKQGLSQAPATIATGLPQLDDILGGGLEPGLYVVTGPPGCGARAFLLNMLWKTVTESKTAHYYCLASGAQRVWEEMVITLSHLLEETGLTRSELHRSEEAGERTERVRRLDEVLVQSFLPYVTLSERLPAGPFPLTAFLRELDGGSGPSTPPALLLLDGMSQLQAALRLSDPLTLGSLLLELDVLLRNRGVPGLLLSEGASGAQGRWETQGVEYLGSGLLSMRRQRGRRRRRLGTSLEEISVRVLKQPGGNRQGRVGLVLDTASGMLAEAPMPGTLPR